MSLQAGQSGAVLLVALILLILITLTGVSTASLIQANTVVLANFEARANARNAAVSALQQAIAKGTLVGGTVFTQACTDTRAVCIDSNGDRDSIKGEDIQVTLGAIECISASVIRNEDLDVFTSPEDASCYQPGVFSLCAEAVWQVEAVASDPVTGATSSVRQGLSTRTEANLLSTACD